MGLDIRLIGELVVTRDGAAVALPASKKTRALLAYLAATGKPQLRERLCALLWDGPDDPRAALRWSLTKLRPLVDDASGQRLVADRDRVELVPGEATIDLVAVRGAVPGGNAAGVARASTEALAAVSSRLHGELLEGLDLPDCYRFDEWLRAEREATRRLGVAILSALVERGVDPLANARGWVGLDPLDEAAHVALIQTLVALGRKPEALTQHASASRLIERELGRTPSRELERLRMAIVDANVSPALRRDAPAPVRIAPPVAPTLPLVGRAQELAALRQLVTTPGPVVVLLGDPGIGKTRLLDEFAVAARVIGLEVLRGRGVEAEQVRPYGAWLDALAGGGATDHPFAGTAETDRARLFEAIVAWLAARAGDRGLVLVIDDLQWIDEATAALLHHVARASSTAAVLRIACGARPGELSDNRAALKLVRGLNREGRVRQIGLSPLDAAETAALAHAHAPGVDPARVFAESGGHPLFAVEIARALARGESAWDSLDALLVERLELIDGAAREVLPWAAALGTAFTADVLAAITGMPLAELARAIDELERRAIVRVAGSEWDFVHDLVRGAAYRRVSEPRRRLLHMQISRMLAAMPDLDGERAGEIVHHAALGGESLACATAAVTAARRALRLAAPEEAAALAERGLDQAARLVGGDRVKLQIDLLAIALHAEPRPHRRADIGKALERAIVDAQVAGCAAEAARGLNELSFLPYSAGNWDAARTMSLDAARRVRDADGISQARTLAFSAQCIALIGREIAQAEQLAHEAIHVLGDEPTDLPTLPLAFGLIRDHQGDAAAAITLYERAIELATRSGLWWVCALCWGNAARIELERGQPRAALAYCDTMREHAEQIGDGGSVPYGAALAALARDELGESSDLDTPLAQLRAADAPVQLAEVSVLIAERALVCGELAVAARHAEVAVAAAARTQRETAIVLAHGVAARVAQADGRTRDHDHHVAALGEVAVDRLSARALALRAELAG